MTKKHFPDFINVFLFFTAPPCRNFECDPGSDNSICLEHSFVCDQHLDCPNGNDEHENCTLTKEPNTEATGTHGDKQICCVLF